MKILAIGKDVPGITDEQFTPHLKSEAARVWELYQSGILREIYFRADQPAGNESGSGDRQQPQADGWFGE